MREPSRLGLYRANLTSPEHRRHITVARRPLVEDTLERLRASTKRRSKHHSLFIGPRGIGKTHLLSLVADEIAGDQGLSARYVVARFPEESHRVLSFADFLLRLCELLRDALPDESDWTTLYDALCTEEDDGRIVDTLVPRIRRANKQHERSVLIMLENLHEMFMRQIKKKKDLAALRKFFMDDNGCALMATAPLHFDAITNVDQPFFDFFDVQILENLSEDETLELVRRNLEWDRKDELLATFDDLRPKLLALYRMTGGNPRLTVMLYELIAHDSITKVREQFELLLDRISPFYQDRLNDLPPQERALLETMAAMRDQEKTPAAIAAQMRLSQPQTSALLKRLADARYIRSTPHPSDKRRRLYTIREGFFDIWLGMNVSRGARRRIPYLLDFFTLFYPSRDERDRKRADLRAKLENLDIRPDAIATLDHLTEVGDPDERARAKLHLASYHVTEGDAGEAGDYVREARGIELDPLGQWIVDHAEPTGDYLAEIDEMIACWDEHRTGNLEAFAERLSAMGEGLSYETFNETKLVFLREHLEHVSERETRVQLRLHIGDLLTDLARWHEAEGQLRTAKAEVGEDSVLHANVLNSLAKVLWKTNQLSEAESLLRRSLELKERTLGNNHADVATRLNNLATVLMQAKRYDEAEPLIRRALKIDEEGLGAEHPIVAIRLGNLASLLSEKSRYDEAEPLVRRALEIDERSLGTEHPNVATHLSVLARLLQDTERFDEAERLIRRACAIDEQAFGADHPNVAYRLSVLASVLSDMNRLDEAEPLMRRALEIDEHACGGDHPVLATHLNNLALLLQDTNRVGEAEPLMRRGIEILRAIVEATGLTHRRYAVIRDNYKVLLRRMNLTDTEIDEKLEPFPPLGDATDR